MAIVALVFAPAAHGALGVSATVEPGAHAAAFRWTTTAPACVTVEVGRTDALGVWLKTPARPRTSGRALLGALEPATTYRFRVSARRGLRDVARSSGTFTTNPFPSWTVVAGIGFFPDHWRPEIAREVGRLSTEISSLAPALLARELPARASIGPVRVGARRFNGATYLIAVNTSWRRVTASVAAPGPRGAGRVFGEDRSVAVRDGAIRDRFGPLDANVYVVEP